MKRSSVSLLGPAIVATFALLSRGSAQDGGELSASLGALVRESGSGLSELSIAVADASTGAMLFEHQADLALNPASNMKLVTAAAALELLGSEHRIRTGLYGRVEGDAVVGGLVLRGYGDPSLRFTDLLGLARDLADRGVRRVDSVVVDASYFDDQLLPPAFEEQPNEVAPFRAATGAVSVDASAYALRILPGDAIGAAARVRLDGAGYFDVDSSITTSDGGEPRIIADQRDLGERMRLVLRGTIPLGSTTLSYRRRIENPLHWAGHLLVDALDAAGIRTTGAVRVAAGPEGAPLVASHLSRPLSELVTAMGKQSDNFVAEMVFRVLGAERHRPGRAADSVAAVREYLEGPVGLPPGAVSVVNGSGLFSGNRIAAGHLVRLLSHVYQTPGIRDEYLAHLAIAGVDGTLERRLLDLPAPRIVRAKTGTLNDAIALSGYVLGREPGRVVAFSVLVNGAAGRHGAARAVCDGVARAIAEHLWR